ncbi:hypothetical protein R3I94_001310 [Phoxinus phoxinus]
MAVWTVYLSLCLLVALSASVETNPIGSERCRVCTDDWRVFGCRCFKFFYNLQTWIDAEKFCLDLDGNLASAHSVEEYTFIERLIRYEAASSTRAWIGGHDAVQEGVWLWSDGTKMNFEYWSPEPDDDWYNERCLELKYTSGGYWDDDVCTVKKPFVCVR